jgi:hypothetical protein
MAFGHSGPSNQGCLPSRAAELYVRLQGMIHRRLKLITTLAVILVLTLVLWMQFPSLEQVILRISGWSVPVGATLRLEDSQGSPWGGSRTFVFDLPSSPVDDEAFCKAMGLPKHVPGPDFRKLLPELRFSPSHLDSEAICGASRPVAGSKLHSVSIQATRRTLVVQWTF